MFYFSFNYFLKRLSQIKDAFSCYQRVLGNLSHYRVHLHPERIVIPLFTILILSTLIELESACKIQF